MKFEIQENKKQGEFFIRPDVPDTIIRFRSIDEAKKAQKWFKKPTPPERERPTLDEVMWQYDGMGTYIPEPCPSKWEGTIIVFTDPFGSRADEVIDYLWEKVHKKK
jgi:hypothetical protein